MLLGSAVGTALDFAAAFYTATWPFLGHAALAAVAAAAALGGAVAGCTVAADVLLLVLWPLAAVFVAAAAMHKFQLRCLAATWRLIRGKEKVCRQGRRHEEVVQGSLVIGARCTAGRCCQDTWLSRAAPTLMCCMWVVWCIVYHRCALFVDVAWIRAGAALQ